MSDEVLIWLPFNFEAVAAAFKSAYVCGQLTEEAEGGIATFCDLTRWTGAAVFCTHTRPCSSLYRGTNPLDSTTALPLTNPSIIKPVFGFLHHQLRA